jgi:type IV pilus assembly protein PilY1
VFYDDHWHTVLVGGLNNGGQGIYALDITDPAPSGATETTIASGRFLWEFTDKESADLGYTYSRPSIVRTRSGKWVAIFGNGYNNTVSDGASTTSGTGNAVLYAVDIKTGALLAKIDTGVGSSSDPLAQSRPNGLSTPAVVDAEGDFSADYVYAGDLFGNLWKFDITDNDPANWKVAYTVSNKPAPLFVAVGPTGKRQPITSKPSVLGGPRGAGLMVLFGTGKFLEPNDRDISKLTPQTFYGVQDIMTHTSADIVTSRSLLTQQTIDYEGTISGTPVRVTSATATTATRGWYLDLISPGPKFQGEMVISNSVLRNRRVIFSTLIPNADLCGYGGTSFLMDMDAFTGARTDYSPFDLDSDGQRTDKDMVTIKVDGKDVTVALSGLGSAVGITGQAAIVTNAAGTLEYQYQTGSGSSQDNNLSGTPKFPPPGALGRQSWRQLR